MDIIFDQRFMVDKKGSISCNHDVRYLVRMSSLVATVHYQEALVSSCCRQILCKHRFQSPGVDAFTPEHAGTSYREPLPLVPVPVDM